jgi:hypothetical protein
MALVHKFLTEQTGTDLFRLTSAQNRARTRQAAGEHGLSVQYAWTDPRKYSSVRSGLLKTGTDCQRK